MDWQWGFYSVDAAITYLRSLKEPACSRAREYVTKAPPQIQTPVRARARAELRLGDVPINPDVLESGGEAHARAD